MAKVLDDNIKELNQRSYDRANNDFRNKLYEMSVAKVSFDQDLKLAKEYSNLNKENPSKDLEMSRLVILRWCLKNYKKYKKYKQESEEIKKRVNHIYKKVK